MTNLFSKVVSEKASIAKLPSQGIVDVKYCGVCVGACDIGRIVSKRAFVAGRRTIPCKALEAAGIK